MTALASVRVQANATLKAFDRIDASARRATMWTVREAGRRVKAEAKRGAPVYSGAGAVKRAKRGERQGRGGAPVKGLLRASVGSSRRLIREGESYAVRVAPRGDRVHLYAGKIEAREGYMSKAYEKVLPQVEHIARGAWARATRAR